MVKSEDWQDHAWLSQVTSFRAGFTPDSTIQPAPVLRHKRATDTRGNIATNQGGFNWQRPAAAEWIHKLTIPIPVAELDQASGHGFTQRSQTHKLTIAALMQTIATGVDCQSCHVSQQRNFNLKRRAGFVKPKPLVRAFQAFHYRLFHSSLDRRYSMQPGQHAAPGNRELRIHRQQVGPRQRLRLVKQGVEIRRRKFAHPNQQSVSTAQPEIAPSNVSLVSLKMNLPVNHAKTGISQPLKFTSHHGLKTKRRSGNQIKPWHAFS